MAWPFSTVVAPNLDSGLTAIPTSVAAIPTVPSTSTPIWLLGASFANTGSVMRTVRITDGNDVQVVPDIEVPAKSVIPLQWAFMPLTGAKWVASGAGIVGKAWGYF